MRVVSGVGPYTEVALPDLYITLLNPPLCLFDLEHVYEATDLGLGPISFMEV